MWNVDPITVTMCVCAVDKVMPTLFYEKSLPTLSMQKII